MALELYSDEYFMNEAIKQAMISFEEDEIPVGAIIVCENRIIAKAYNQTERLNDSTAHAEMIALTSAFNNLGSKYLTDCTLYVTLEPCIMCAGAMHWAQIQKLVYGAPDMKKGFSRIKETVLHPKTEVQSGVLADESKRILDEFFKNLRTQ